MAVTLEDWLDEEEHQEEKPKLPGGKEGTMETLTQAVGQVSAAAKRDTEPDKDSTR